MLKIMNETRAGSGGAPGKRSAAARMARESRTETLKLALAIAAIVVALGSLIGWYFLKYSPSVNGRQVGYYPVPVGSNPKAVWMREHGMAPKKP